MSARVIANNSAVLYDSSLPRLALSRLIVNKKINDAGSAEFTIPADSGALQPGDYQSLLIPYRCIIEIYRDGDSTPLFRGRVISGKKDFYNSKVVTCEGEAAFFRDSVVRPHTYSGSLEWLFQKIVSLHNAQVDQYKGFFFGSVTVVTTESVPSLTVERTITAAEALKKLRETYGGYITFSTDAQGKRRINWLAQLGSAADQTICYGKNLLDLAVTTTNKDYANRIYAYGKMVNDEYITLDVDGHDYVEDAAAQAVYGIVTKILSCPDVEDDATLLVRAGKALAESSVMIDSITVSALDLSRLAKVPQFSEQSPAAGLDVGLAVYVESPPHGVNGTYMITQRTYDLLNPKNDKITLGGSEISLTEELAVKGGYYQ